VHHAQLGLVAGGELAQARFQVGGGHQQPAALAHQGVAGRGEGDARPMAFEQAQVQLALELAHGVGHGRGHFVQALGRGGKGAVAGNGVDQFDGFEAEAAHVRNYRS
jgi:hypothetical protein